MPQTHTFVVKHSPGSIQASLVLPQLCLGGNTHPLGSGCRGSLGGLNVSRHSLIQPGATTTTLEQASEATNTVRCHPQPRRTQLSLTRLSGAQLNPLWLQEASGPQHLPWLHRNGEQLCFPASFPSGRGLKHIKLPHGSIFPVSSCGCSIL